MQEILPIFKSHYSIGKSILTLEDPSHSKEGGPDSIFSILKDNKLNQLVLIEDNMSGFLDAFKYCDKNSIQLIFGLNFLINDFGENKDENLDIYPHKICVLSKNSDGIKDLIKLFSFSQSKKEKELTSQELLNMWTNNLQLFIPFYDSFIFNNTMYFCNCIFDIDKKFGKVYFCIENNGLPFDNIVKYEVDSYCSANSRETINCKTILYKNKEDIDTFLTLKIINNRTFGKQRTLEEPNIEGFSSDEFCWESYLEENKK